MLVRCLVRERQIIIIILLLLSSIECLLCAQCYDKHIYVLSHLFFTASASFSQRRKLKCKEIKGRSQGQTVVRHGRGLEPTFSHL